ncbi:MAG TPA: hypothetical protein VGJ26_06060, partial [Pirellulales bacterium]
MASWDNILSAAAVTIKCPAQGEQPFRRIGYKFVRNGDCITSFPFKRAANRVVNDAAPMTEHRAVGPQDWQLQS